MAKKADARLEKLSGFELIRALFKGVDLDALPDTRWARLQALSDRELVEELFNCAAEENVDAVVYEMAHRAKERGLDDPLRWLYEACRPVEH
jgi:hypothetical protein